MKRIIENIIKGSLKMSLCSIELRAIQKVYKQGGTQIEVLKDISANFVENSSYAITGVSGSGKSTLLHIISGLDTPTTGNIIISLPDGTSSNLNKLSSEQRAQYLNKYYGLVFQQPYLMNELTVIENIVLKGLIAKKPALQQYQKAELLLKRLGLYEKKDSKPSRLSGGQQQRVAIIRAIFNEPLFLIADEPTANLDEAHVQSVIDLFLECKQQWNMCLIISTHDMQVAERMQYKFRIYDGQLIPIN